MAQPGQLVLTQAGQQSQVISLSKDTVTLGRSVTADIVLPDPKVSREHVRLECRAGGCTVVDLGSANGTWLNGIRIQKGTLTPADTLTLGDCTLRFEPAQAAFEPDVTRLDTAADVELTIARSAVEIMVSDTRLPRLTIHTPGKTWEVPLTEDSLLIGRDAAADVVLDDPKVSRRHARIERQGNRFVIRDLQSTNGILRGSRGSQSKVDDYTLVEGETLRIGPAQILFKPGIQPEDLTLVTSAFPGARPGTSASHPPVVLVPGLMGSELWRGSERIWPNLRNVLYNPDIFRWPGEGPVEPRGIVGEVVVVPNLIKLEQYSRLSDYLEEALGYERGKDLLEFAYDWRQDARVSARRLAEAIEQWDVQGPITIIAHSFGCLVGRYYVECLGGKRKTGRLLLLGGPHEGVPRTLTGIYSGLDGVFGLLGDQIRQVVASFPSTYQTLPTYACAFDAQGQTFDLLADVSWMENWQHGMLAEARAFRRELGSRSSVATVSIFGYGQRTITGLSFTGKSAGSRLRAEILTESSGDGSVPQQSSVLPGSEIHPVLQQHGALYVDSDVKMRLKLELTRQNGEG